MKSFRSQYQYQPKTSRGHIVYYVDRIKFYTLFDLDFYAKIVEVRDDIVIINVIKDRNGLYGIRGVHKQELEWLKNKPRSCIQKKIDVSTYDFTNIIKIIEYIDCIFPYKQNAVVFLKIMKLAIYDIMYDGDIHFDIDTAVKCDGIPNIHLCIENASEIGGILTSLLRIGE